MAFAHAWQRLVAVRLLTRVALKVEKFFLHNLNVQPDTLKQRADFLLAQKIGDKVITKGIILQSKSNDLDAIRVGYTVTRKVGSAVVRNRIKRRLRVIVQQCSDLMTPGNDYVLIGRKATLTRTLPDLSKDLRYALHQVKGDTR